MRHRAGDRGVEAAIEARSPAGGAGAAGAGAQTADQARRRRLQQAASRTRGYLSKLRSGTA